MGCADHGSQLPRFTTTLTGLLKGDGTNPITAAVPGIDYLTPNGSAADLINFPTLNQSTTGNAANVTGTVAVANGGTGLTAAGTRGQVLTSKGDGTLEWTGTYTIDVVNEDLGGYVFYLTPDRKHGLVVTTINQSLSSKWFDAENVISDPDNHNDAGKNFTDWRLPTLYELGEIIKKRDQIVSASGVPTSFPSGKYWSSTTISTDFGNTLEYNPGTIFTNSPIMTSKGDANRVRAVRSF